MSREALAVEITDVSKTFGNTTVIDHLSLTIPPGQIYGMIGPSGCGKTTTVRMLVGVLAPTSGRVSVMGADPAHFTTRQREAIGYMPQGFYLYPTLTVQENANFVASLFGVGWRRRGRRVREVLDFLELWPARKRLARDVSGGMQRRLELACALLHDPHLLFVDEPTAGLDPVLREKVWEHLRTLREQGRTILVTTQYIDEARYCDTVAVMVKGRLAASGTPDELRQQAMGGEAVDLTVEGLTRADVGELWQMELVSRVDRTGNDTLRVMVEDAATATPAITQALQERGRTVVSASPYVPTFDEVFMKVVGEQEDGSRRDA